MKYFRFLFVIIIIPVFFSSCKKETAEPVEMGYKYFPVNTGHWVIYNVDSISYNDFTGETDSFRYQIKEYVESVFIDNSGRTSQRLERYIRYSETADWTIKDVWFETLTASCAERVEENLRMVKLIFPVEESQTWDGNAYNTLGAQTYKFQDVHTPAVINNVSLDSTLTVIQKSSTTLISEDFQQEIYSVNIGMVYKKYVSLVKEPTGEITSGIDYSYTLQSYGN
ncbi:MAG TPA: hypothetical protein PKI01_02030 [Bacteroidales bacterium]|nr:hypothetical protein [Bacteroidales bacterium]